MRTLVSRRSRGNRSHAANQPWYRGTDLVFTATDSDAGAGVSLLSIRSCCGTGCQTAASVTWLLETEGRGLIPWTTSRENLSDVVTEVF
jgi:hypothetical protein